MAKVVICIRAYCNRLSVTIHDTNLCIFTSSDEHLVINIEVNSVISVSFEAISTLKLMQFAGDQ